MANLSVFNFESNEVRFIDGLPVANDVAKVLGYADPAKTISTKVKDKNKGVTKMVTVDGKLRDVTVLKEAGIYQLIFSSKLESAQKFQDWVFEEVLPSIRKTGSYSVQPQLPQTYLEALKALVASEEEKLLLQSQNQQLQAKVEQDAPLVAYAEAVRFSEDSVDFNTYAKMIGTGRTSLFRQMRECGVVMKNSTLPYQRFVDAGYFEVSQEIDSENGKLIPFALVTGKGQIWLKQRLDEFARIEQGVLKSFAQLAVF